MIAFKDNRLPAFAAAVALSIFVTSCARVPTEEFNTYRTAFAEAARAGEILLNKVADTITRKEAPKLAERQALCTGVNRPYPKDFCPDVVLKGAETNESRTVQMRRAAYRSIGAFNQTLLSLAHGEGTGALSPQVEELSLTLDLLVELGTNATGMPAGWGLAMTGASKLAKGLDDIRGAERFRESMLEGAPVIASLIDIMTADTVDLYTAYSGQLELEIAKLSLAVGDAKVAGNPDQAQALEASKAALYADINAYHNSLGAYVRLMDETKKALNVLVGILRRPVVSDLFDVRDIIRASISIRDEADAFWESWRQLN